MPSFFLTKVLYAFILPVEVANEKASVIYATYGENKKTIYQDKMVYPIIDCLLKKEQDSYLNITFSRKCDNEFFKSEFIQEKLNVFEFFLSLFYFDKNYFKDFYFTWKIYFSILAYSDRGEGKMNTNTRYFHFLKVFFGARYLSIKYRNVVGRNVKRVYVTQYYNVRMLALIKICNTRGIKVFDVQHGYIGTDHPAYDKSLRLNTDYKPNGFCVFDNEYCNYIRAFYPSSNIEITNWEHLRAFHDVSKAKTGSKRILYSVQWGTPLPAVLESMVRKYSNVQWVFRMHPLEFDKRDDLGQIASMEHVSIEEKGVNLVESILQSDIHITWNSSLCFEAEQLGVISYYFSEHDKVRFVDTNGNEKKLIRYLPLNNYETVLDELLG